MLIGEVPPTPYDLHFQVGPFPIRISPFFWLLALIITAQSTPDGMGIILGTLAILLSILIHELGHSIAFAQFGVASRIVLYHFGGLAIPDPYHSPSRMAALGPRELLIIAAAGPFAQLAVAVLGIIGLALGGFMLPDVAQVSFLPDTSDGQPLPSGAWVFFDIFLFASIYWSILNLAPIFPLDGGQIARNLMLLTNVPDPYRNSLMLSVATGAALALFSLTHGNLFLVFMFGSLAYSSYQQLHGFGGPFQGGRW